MLKVIIVDDEMLVRIGIKTVINWEEHDFIIVGEAGNGEAALELCRNVLPDIVLTDIKMPVMDGLEFYRELKKILPSTKVIILSCYGEFEYIKEALKLGAEDYILKMTMTPNELLGIMNNVKEKIAGENVAQNEINKLRIEIKKSHQLLKDNFLKELVFSNIYTTEQIDERFSTLNLDITNRNLVIIVLKVDNLNSLSTFRTEKDINLMNFAILNITNEILSNYTNTTVFQNDHNEFVLLFCFHREVSTEKIEHTIFDILGKIKNTIMKYLNFSVSAGVSHIHNSYDKLFCAYTESSLALEKRFYRNAGTILFYEEEVFNEEAIDILSLTQQYTLHNAIEEKNLEQFKLLLNNITGSFKGYPTIKVKQACFELLLSFNDGKNNETQKIIEKYDSYNHIFKFDFLESIKEYMCKIAEDIIVNSFSQTDRNSIVGRAKQYVRQHYNEEISLLKISSSVNVSKNYFCQLFKTETNENFITYLTGYRIEKAKELIARTEFKTYEIAEKVGIPNTRHFSKLFKKQTGMLPTEYKHRHTK